MAYAQNLVCFNTFGSDESWTLRTYEKHDGYKAWRRVLAGELSPEQIIDEVKASGLRGRGGAGFPCGVKWGFLPKGVMPRYLCVNADESEPGTFKDRTIMMEDPHRFIEGCIITCWAIGAHKCWIYVRGELVRCIERLDAAIAA